MIPTWGSKYIKMSSGTFLIMSEVLCWSLGLRTKKQEKKLISQPDAWQAALQTLGLRQELSQKAWCHQSFPCEKERLPTESASPNCNWKWLLQASVWKFWIHPEHLAQITCQHSFVWNFLKIIEKTKNIHRFLIRPKFLHSPVQMMRIWPLLPSSLSSYTTNHHSGFSASKGVSCEEASYRKKPFVAEANVPIYVSQSCLPHATHNRQARLLNIYLNMMI